MAQLIQPRTKRLQLRQWRAEDRAPFAALNADPQVMAYFPQTLNRCESDALADRCEAFIAEKGWGFWAVELLNSGDFIGFVGLNEPSAPLPFSPCVEIGWRLSKPYWGQGFATEAAQTSLQVGFGRLELPEILAFAVVGNSRSTAVMERLHMAWDEQTFAHPSVPKASGLRQHYLYRLSSAAWRRHGAR